MLNKIQSKNNLNVYICDEGKTPYGVHVKTERRHMAFFDVGAIQGVFQHLETLHI